MLSSKTKAELFLFSNTIIWGSTFVIIKDALGSVSPMFFVSLRFFIAAILLFVMFRKYLGGTTALQKKQGFILGIYLFVGFATQTIGLVYTTATKSAFITGTFVVFTPLFQALWEKRIPPMSNIVGIILVFTGIVFLSSREDNVLSILYETGSTFNFGDFLTLLCAISYGLYMVYIDMISRQNDYRFLTFAQIVTTALLGFLSVGLFAATGIEEFSFSLNGTVVFAVLYTAVFATIVTTTVQARFQKETTPTKTSILFSFEPVFAAVFAFVLIGEKISLFGVFGGVLILCGLLVSELIGRDNTEQKQSTI